MKLITTLLVFALLASSAPETKKTVPPGYDVKLYEKARKLAHEAIVIDGHIDVPYRLEEKMQDISKSTVTGEFDFPRAKAGGLDAPFMSIYIPAEFQETPNASKKVAEKLIAMMDSVISKHPDKFASALTPADIRSNFQNGRISMPYGMENGSPIEDDLSNLRYFFDKGVRYITLTHSKMNRICDSSYDSNKGWNGLSPFGRKVVLEMNRLGILVDISHVSDSTFYQVLKLSKVPVICSHSSLRHFVPGKERNVSDDMLKELAKNGGVIQINFGSPFLTDKANKYSARWSNHRKAFMREHSIADEEDPRVKAESVRYRAQDPYPYADVTDVADHIDRAVKIAGIDHVGIGSDFDGVGDSLPTGLKSVADFPNLVYHLLKRGYSEEDIKKILGENVLRVWEKAITYANKQHN